MCLFNILYSIEVIVQKCVMLPILIQFLTIQRTYFFHLNFVMDAKGILSFSKLEYVNP